MTLLVKGGRVINPALNQDEVCDILIENGKIKAMGNDIDSKGLMYSMLRDALWHRVSSICMSIFASQDRRRKKRSLREAVPLQLVALLV